MIVVLGSRHDSAAQSMIAALPGAALCSAEDLTRPGWVWPLGSSESPRWVVGGRVVEDDEVTGVLVRRTCVYPEELTGTHPDDREYLAAESTAFLIFVLSRTGARVVNPVLDGALGEDVMRPERWMARANDLGIDLAPLRLKSGGKVRAPKAATTVEVVGDAVFGDAPRSVQVKATALAAALGLGYAAFVFDPRHRLITISASRPPGEAALRALRSVLGARSRG